jgi:hypothetical protein
MARKVGILSDEWYHKNCDEYRPLKVGLSQKLYPYIQNNTLGIKVPKYLPIAQRGYQMDRVAMNISKITKAPYAMTLLMLQNEQRRLKDERIPHIIPQTNKSHHQASMLSFHHRPATTQFTQVQRKVGSSAPLPTSGGTGGTGATATPSTAPTGPDVSKTRFSGAKAPKPPPSGPPPVKTEL